MIPKPAVSNAVWKIEMAVDAFLALLCCTVASTGYVVSKMEKRTGALTAGVDVLPDVC